MPVSSKSALTRILILAIALLPATIWAQSDVQAGAQPTPTNSQTDAAAAAQLDQQILLQQQAVMAQQQATQQPQTAPPTLSAPSGCLPPPPLPRTPPTFPGKQRIILRPYGSQPAHTHIYLPLPRAIRTARRIYIARGARCAWFADPGYAFGAFKAAMRHWGKYQLATSPATAQLEFRFDNYCPTEHQNYRTGPTINLYRFPRLRLTISDLRSNSVLGVLVQPMRYAALQSSRNQNLDRAIRLLVDRLRNQH